MTLTQAGCSAMTSRQRVVSRQASTSEIDPGDPSSPMQISAAYRNSMNPATLLDIVGDGSGAMGHYCKRINGDQGTGSTDGTTTCNCVYSFQKPVVNDSGVEELVSETVEVPTVYSEENLIRCKYTAVPRNLTGAFLVKVKTTDSAMKSNQIEAKFTAGVGDPTDWSAFAEAKRYQCRDLVSIPHMFSGSSMYDPILSDDPAYTYPMDFYTTNMGATFSQYSALNTQGGWQCPSYPNDPRFGTNLKLFSRIPDADGNYQIYPKPASSHFDRTLFHLARRQTGVFNVPVNALVAPQIMSSEGTQVPPIGYGARPLADEGESCPNIDIPKGYQWVKVWVFRTALEIRHYKTTNLAVNLNSVSCNPGAVTGADNKPTALFSDCADPSFPLVGGRTYVNSSFGLADRVLGGSNMCVKLENPAGCASGVGTGCTSVDRSNQRAGFERFAAGTDIWQPIQKTAKCGTSTTSDPLNLCNGGVPGTTELGVGNIDAQNRYDFLFIVTPPGVKTSDWRDTTSQISQTYTPIRFPLASDCSSSDPNNCDRDKAFTYGPIFHDVGQPGDPSGSDKNRSGVFPICAIQPVS